jgi:methylated-DNA-protein-cysteine methyltransferase-like protein
MPQRPSQSRFTAKVYDVVRRVPRGRVTWYGAVAALAGSPRAARGVGAALNALTGPETDGDQVPWWRVVNRAGRLTIPAEMGLRSLQRVLLESEGVTFDADGAVRLDLHGWDPFPGDPD